MEEWVIIVSLATGGEFARGYFRSYETCRTWASYFVDVNPGVFHISMCFKREEFEKRFPNLKVVDS